MSAGRVIVYGGKGALGSRCVSLFKDKNYWVGSIDFKINEEADGNVLVKAVSAIIEQEREVFEQLLLILGKEKVDAIFCVAGGWAGGNAASKDFIKSADDMWKQSVWPSLISAQLASRHLKDGGLLTLPGAQPGTSATPGMIGYGMAKSAVHHLVRSLAAGNSGMPGDSCVVAILPVTLDTAMNRKWMSQADTSTWTPLDFVAELFLKWI